MKNAHDLSRAHTGREPSEIGGLLGRAASTISRELVRGEGEDGCYSPQAAHAVYEARRGRCRRPCKLIEGSGLHGWVRDWLVHFRWSPEQIAGRLKAMEPDDPGSRVSHETIYAAIYTHPRGGLRAAMIVAAGQALAGTQAHNARGQLHGPGNLADYPPPGGDRGPDTGRAISSKELSTARRWARWWSARHASSFFAKWTATPQRRPWKGSPGR